MRLITVPRRRRSTHRNTRPDACRTDCRSRRGPAIAPLAPRPARSQVGACTPQPIAIQTAIDPRSDRPSRTASASPHASAGARRRVIRRVVLIGELVVLTLLVSASATHGAHAEVVRVLADSAGLSQAETVLNNIRNWVMGILGSIATVFLSIGFVRRIVGAGDPEEQGKAKEAFKAAGIGYAGAALTPLIITILQGIVGS
jgi:hypothetical protein